MIRCVVEGERVVSRTNIPNYRYHPDEGQQVVDIEQEWPADRNGDPLRKRDVHYDGKRVVPGAPPMTFQEKKAALRQEYGVYDLIEDDSKLQEYRQRLTEL